MIVLSSVTGLRVFTAFALLFVGIPLLMSGQQALGRNTSSSRSLTLLAAFARLSFGIEAGCLCLGVLQLCLPGLLMTLSVALVLTQCWSVYRHYIPAEEQTTVIPRLIHWMDAWGANGSPLRMRRLTLSQPSTVAVVLALASFIPTSWSALLETHFTTPEMYSRAVSLGTVLSGQPWQPDGSVALLAPLVVLSGVSPASVLRFSGPLFCSAVLTLLGFWLWKALNRGAGRWAILLVVLVLVPACFQLGPLTVDVSLLALCYVLTAAFIAAEYPGRAIEALLTAMMIAPQNWFPISIICILIGATHFGLTRLRLQKHSYLYRATSLSGVVLWLLLSPLQRPSSELLQYEAAARKCVEITQRFDRNGWLIVSPFQELAFTYGKGWHQELSEFVSKYSVDQVADPGFSFPYATLRVFFFVERRPLAPGIGRQPGKWHYSPATSSDWPAYLYNDPIGRQLLEFRAAELLSAYRRSHKDLRIYFEDENLDIYELSSS